MTAAPAATGPAVPRRGWWWVAGLVGLTAALGADVALGGVSSALDPWAQEVALAHRAPGLTTAVGVVTDVGGGGGRPWIALAVAGAVALRVRRSWPLLTAAAALALVPLVNAALKRLVDRPRPPLADAVRVHLDPSFPSGHAMGATGLAVVLAGIVLAVVRGRAARAAVVGIAVLGAGAVGVSRVQLGAHWASDVLAGWACGAACGLAVLLVASAVGERATTAGPSARPPHGPRRHRRRPGHGHRRGAAGPHLRPSAPPRYW